VQKPANHLLLGAEDSEEDLIAELSQAFSGAKVRPETAGLVEAEFPLIPGSRLPHLAFARQWLPNYGTLRASSVSAWAGELFAAIVGVLPDDQPWSLHLEPHYGFRAVHRTGARAWHTAVRRGSSRHVHATQVEAQAPGPEAGRHRCRLIREALDELLHRKRRHLQRRLRDHRVPFTEEDSLAQLWLTTPDTGILSLAQAPVPFEQRHLLSIFPKGEVPRIEDTGAPSRAFAKLVEAEQRLGRAIQTGETCVDLGASPGSWSYVAARRGARVVAVDRTALREDLMGIRGVEFRQGDAFRFRPDHPADWLLCDVIAPAERTAGLLLEWLRHGWCRHFIVTLKLKERADVEVLAGLKRELPPLTRELFLLRLCANKREVCAFGSAA
jgi:23S rRNA (cytidine2498-2'-O)-methyltransferase